MQVYRILCSDIDGTLLNKDREISALTIREFQRIQNTTPCILISSRMPQSMRKLQQQLGIESHPVIAYNGSLILMKEEALLSITVPLEIVESIGAYCSNTDIHISLYHHDEWVVPEMDYWANREARNTKIDPLVLPLAESINKWKNENKECHKVMCMGDEKEIDTLFEKLVEQHAQQLNIYRSKPTYIEISNKAKDKASAMQHLLNELYPQHSMQHVIAFGDNHNDKTLLQKAGLGVAVANAEPQILEIANEITASNIEDGVALSISKYFPATKHVN